MSINNHNLDITRSLTQKEYEKVLRNIEKKKSVKIYNCKSYCGGFQESIEVRDGELYVALYTRRRRGGDIGHEVLAFPVQLNNTRVYKDIIEYIDDSWRTSIYKEKVNFVITAQVTYDEVEANTFTDNFGNPVTIGDEVYYTTGKYQEMRKGKIIKMTDCKVTVEKGSSYATVGYYQIGKVIV